MVHWSLLFVFCVQTRVAALFFAFDVWNDRCWGSVWCRLVLGDRRLDPRTIGIGWVSGEDVASVVVSPYF